jgi:two-component system CheB/CheR fusion protein
MLTKKAKSKKVKSDIDKPLIKSSNLFPVVGIGASAGGLDAFKKLLKAIPEDSGMAYVLVQHLDPSHESLLQELLQKVTNIPVLEIAEDIKVEPNHIYVIPSNKMMVATDGVLQLSPRPRKNKNERNLPIDHFFSSLAEVHQSHAIGVVLSGTASDGTLGLKAIKDHGGITFAQDEASAAYEGMPHSAVQAGVVDFILPPEKIPQKILEVIKIINHKGNGHDVENMPLKDEEVFKQILSLLRIRKGTDFTYYKQTTIRRRILRRMAINKRDEPSAYLKYLKENKTEQDVLYQDLLIPVTGFFRDPRTFDNLCETVFPHIVKNKIPGEPIRIWVAGCSTGEEAYSIAICLKEYLGEDNSGSSAEKVQIFATDISEPAIAKARAGIYSKSDTVGLTPQRLQEFFTKTNGSYQANKSIRDICVFAIHNFLKDPPFGKMDLISCRNVLIYMEPYLQKKGLTTFHYSLNPKGFLLLGKSETTSGVPELFITSQLKEGKTDKLFIRKDVPGKFMHVASQRTEQNFSQNNTSTITDNIRTDFQKTADDIMLRKYTPAGVVVNEAMDIVHFRGNTGNYLQQSPGKPSHNLLKMAKEGLAFELRNILHKAKKQKAPVIKENIPVDINGVLQHISIEALLLPDTIEPHYLVLFHDKQIDNGLLAAGGKKTTAGKTKKDERDIRIQQLEKELAQSREDMRSITEDQEAANEELQSANEELLSSSEELQSLNEELETGKEELQSTNEELMVINQEMISLNEQVTAARDYAEAIIVNIREPLLVLDKNLRIKTANNAFYKTFRVNEKETESVMIYDLGNKQWDIPELRTLLEKILPEKSVFNDFEVTHTFSSIGERIMLLNAREVINKNSLEKLILLSIEDITERKRAEEILNKSGEHFRLLVKELPAAVYSCDAKGYITFYNDAAAKLWGRKPVISKERWCGSSKLFKPDGSPIPLDKCPMAITIKESRSIVSEEIIIERPDGSRSNVLVNPHPEYGLNGELTGAINMLFDITEQVKAKNIIEESEKKFRQMAELMPQKVWTSDAMGHKNYFNKTLLNYAGMSTQELEGEGWEKIMHPEDWENNKKQWEESLRTGKIYEAENRLLRKDGKYLWHLTQAVPVKDKNDNIVMWVGSKTEIDSMKMEEIRKGDFIKMVSHELKTPVTSIKGYVQLLLMMTEDLYSEQNPSLVKDSLTRIDRQIIKLTRLIAEMLDLTRIEANRLELQTELFDLNTLVGEIIEDIRYTNTSHVIKLVQDVHCMVMGDKGRIEQVLINLVANAIKYSPDFGPIEVRIDIIQNNQVAVSVKDQGIGIEETEHKKIFDRFYRVDGKSEQTFPGFGIGLFIANEIIERHNGFIKIESEKGKGSTFTFILPIAPEGNNINKEK